MSRQCNVIRKILIRCDAQVHSRLIVLINLMSDDYDVKMFVTCCKKTPNSKFLEEENQTNVNHHMNHRDTFIKMSVFEKVKLP